MTQISYVVIMWVFSMERGMSTLIVHIRSSLHLVTAARVLSLKLRVFYLDLCCLDARTRFRFLYLL